MELVAASEPDSEVKEEETTREILGNQLYQTEEHKSDVKALTALPDSKTDPSIYKIFFIDLVIYF